MSDQSENAFFDISISFPIWMDFWKFSRAGQALTVKVHLQNFHFFPYLRREGPPVLKMRSYSIQLLNCANQREDFSHKIFILPDEQHATVDQHQICGKCDVVVVFLMVMVVVRRCQLCWGWHMILTLLMVDVVRQRDCDGVNGSQVSRPTLSS